MAVTALVSQRLPVLEAEVAGLLQEVEAARTEIAALKRLKAIVEKDKYGLVVRTSSCVSPSVRSGHLKVRYQ